MMAEMKECCTDATSVRHHVSIVVTLAVVAMLHFPPVSGQAACTTQNCLPPNCFCKGGGIPGSIPVGDTPQMVMLTFDDAVNNANFPLYQQLYANKINPNGCPARGTFYVCHDYSNYQMIQTLYNQGHEIASHSISHRLPSGWWSWASPAEWASEMEGQRQILSLWASIPKSEIRGMRAPYLAVGGDSQFQMIRNLLTDNFVYDASIVSSVHRRSAFISPTWPYTMDYPPSDECLIPPCPSQSFPGVWEIPLDSTQGLNSQWCSMADECTPGMSENQVYNYLLNNLNRHYTSSRAPFGIYLHGPWLDDPAHFRALDRFISDVTSRGDIYFVTAWQVIQWMRNPVPLSQLRNNFCPFRQNSASCNETQANFCLFDDGANRVNRKKRSASLNALNGETLDSVAFAQGRNGSSVDNSTLNNVTDSNVALGQARNGSSVDNSTVTNTTGPRVAFGLGRNGTSLDNSTLTNTTGSNIGQSTNPSSTPSPVKRRKRAISASLINNSTLNSTDSNATTDANVALGQARNGSSLDNSTGTNVTGPSVAFGQARNGSSVDNSTFSNVTDPSVGLGQARNGSLLNNSTVVNTTGPFAALAESRNPDKFDLKYLKSASQIAGSQDSSRTRSSRRKRQTYNGWHNMYTCTPCPQSYPWIGNPLGL